MFLNFYLNIKEWQEIVAGSIKPYEVRKNYVHVHGILLHALGIVGHSLKEQCPNSWKSRLKLLSKIDWRKSNNKDWEGRSMIGGRLTKATMNILLTSNLLKMKLNLKLNKKEKELEEKINRSI